MRPHHSEPARNTEGSADKEKTHRSSAPERQYSAHQCAGEDTKKQLPQYSPRRNNDRFRKKDMSYYRNPRHRNSNGYGGCDRHAGPMSNRSVASRNHHSGRNQTGYCRESEFDRRRNCNHFDSERFHSDGNRPFRSDFGSSGVGNDNRVADCRPNGFTNDRLEPFPSGSRVDTPTGGSRVSHAELPNGQADCRSNTFSHDRLEHIQSGSQIDNPSGSSRVSRADLPIAGNLQNPNTYFDDRRNTVSNGRLDVLPVGSLYDNSTGRTIVNPNDVVTASHHNNRFLTIDNRLIDTSNVRLSGAQMGSLNDNPSGHYIVSNLASGNATALCEFVPNLGNRMIVAHNDRLETLQEGSQINNFTESSNVNRGDSLLPNDFRRNVQWSDRSDGFQGCSRNDNTPEQSNINQSIVHNASVSKEVPSWVDCRAVDSLGNMIAQQVMNQTSLANDSQITNKIANIIASQLPTIVASVISGEELVKSAPTEIGPPRKPSPSEVIPAPTDNNIGQGKKKRKKKENEKRKKKRQERSDAYKAFKLQLKQQKDSGKKQESTEIPNNDPIQMDIEYKSSQNKPEDCRKSMKSTLPTLSDKVSARTEASVTHPSEKNSNPKSAHGWVTRQSFSAGWGSGPPCVVPNPVSHLKNIFEVEDDGRSYAKWEPNISVEDVPKLAGNSPNKNKTISTPKDSKQLPPNSSRNSGTSETVNEKRPKVSDSKKVSSSETPKLSDPSEKMIDEKSPIVSDSKKISLSETSKSSVPSEKMVVEKSPKISNSEKISSTESSKGSDPSEMDKVKINKDSDISTGHKNDTKDSKSSSSKKDNTQVKSSLSKKKIKDHTPTSTQQFDFEHLRSNPRFSDAFVDETFFPNESCVAINESMSMKQILSNWQKKLLSQLSKERLFFRLLWTSTMSLHIVGLRLFSTNKRGVIDIMSLIGEMLVGQCVYITEEDLIKKKKKTVAYNRNYLNMYSDIFQNPISDFLDFRFICAATKYIHAQRVKDNRCRLLNKSYEIAKFWFGKRSNCSLKKTIHLADNSRNTCNWSRVHGP